MILTSYDCGLLHLTRSETAERTLFVMPTLTSRRLKRERRMKPLIKPSNLSIALVIYMGCATYGVPAAAQRLDAGTGHSCVVPAEPTASFASNRGAELVIGGFAPVKSL